MRPRIPQGVTRQSHIVRGGGGEATTPLPISAHVGAAPRAKAHRALCRRALARTDAPPRCARPVTKKRNSRGGILPAKANARHETSTADEALRSAFERRAARAHDGGPHPGPRGRALRRGGGRTRPARRRPRSDDGADGLVPHPVRRLPPRGRRSHARPRARRRQRPRHAALRARRRHRGGGRSRRDRSPSRHRRGPALLPAAVGERGGRPALLRAGDRARQERPERGGREPARRARARQRSPEVGVDPLPLRRFSQRHAVSEVVVRDAHARRRGPRPRSLLAPVVVLSDQPHGERGGRLVHAAASAVLLRVRQPRSRSTRSAPPPTARRPPTPTSTSRASSAST